MMEEHTEVSPQSPKDSKSEGFVQETAREVGKDLVSGTKKMLKWALGGSIVGALVVGGIGVRLLGMEVLAISALIGAVIGAIAGGGMYLWWLSPFD
jgi:uncharacterized protein YcfJ